MTSKCVRNTRGSSNWRRFGRCEHKTVEEFADGYYSSALAVYNSMFEARQLLATFDKDAA